MHVAYEINTVIRLGSLELVKYKDGYSFYWSYAQSKNILWKKANLNFETQN